MKSFSLLEEGEVHAAIVAMLHKTGMGREIVVFTMFQYKQATVCQQGQCLIGDVFQVLQRIWRVGKDDVLVFLA